MAVSASRAVPPKATRRRTAGNVDLHYLSLCSVTPQRAMTSGGRNHRNRFVACPGERPRPPRGRRPEHLAPAGLRHPPAASGCRRVKRPAPHVHLRSGRDRRCCDVSERRRPGSRRTTRLRLTTPARPPACNSGRRRRPDVRNAAPDVSTTTSRRATGEMISLTAAMPRNGGSVGSASSASSAGARQLVGCRRARPRSGRAGAPVRCLPLPDAGRPSPSRCRSCGRPPAPAGPGGTRELGPLGFVGLRTRSTATSPPWRSTPSASAARVGRQRHEAGAEPRLGRTR